MKQVSVFLVMLAGVAQGTMLCFFKVFIFILVGIMYMRCNQTTAAMHKSKHLLNGLFRNLAEGEESC